MNMLLCAGLLFRLDGVRELLTSSHSSMDIIAKTFQTQVLGNFSCHRNV